LALDVTGRLALSLTGQKRFNEAEALCLEGLEICERTIGEEHSTTQGLIGMLGNIYASQERYDEARNIYLRMIEIKKRMHGKEHPSTLISMHNFAVICGLAMRLTAAEEMNREILGIRRRTLGVEHPMTLVSMIGLTNAIVAQRRYEEGELLLDEVFQNSTGGYGEALPEVPTTAIALESIFANLSWGYSTAADPEKRDPQKAVEFVLKAMKLSESANQWTILGVAFYRNGEYANAVDALDKEGFDKEGFGYNAIFLAMAHWQLGNEEQARAFYDRSIAWRENNPTDEQLNAFYAEAEKLLESEMRSEEDSSTAKSEHVDSGSMSAPEREAAGENTEPHDEPSEKQQRTSLE
jgi:tetratricopeptide (TPR) repeat protein